MAGTSLKNGALTGAVELGETLTPATPARRARPGPQKSMISVSFSLTSSSI